MKTLPRLLTLAGAAALLTLGALPTQAQRGDFDPEQFRTRMMERYREQLKVDSDSEWKIVETRITAVMEARRELASLTPRGRGGRGGRGGGGGGDQADRGDQERGRGRGGPGGPGGFGFEPGPEVGALEKAVEAGGAEEIKAKLAAWRAARQEKEAKLTKAQGALREVLSVNQEGAAVLAGLLE